MKITMKNQMTYLYRPHLEQIIEIFCGAFSESILEEAVQVFEEKRYTVKETDVTYRAINHWSKQGLLNDNRAKGEKKWRKLSIKDLLWIGIIIELRKFSMSIKQILRCKENLFKNSDFYFPSEVSLFDFIAVSCMIENKTEFYLKILNDGTTNLFTKSDFQLNEGKKNNDWDSHLSLNLNQIFEKIVSKDLGERFKANSPILVDLTNSETEVIHALRVENLSQVTLYMNNGNVSRLEKVRHFGIKENIFKVIKDMPFCTAVIKTCDGKINLFEVKESVKLTNESE
jgi:DNA-binding transcriptional MerR regulator